ncbi:MAG: hypothetical protein R3338_11450 [Thermoanaerobaculia bacterium]|nr:hypothetical protein [Thermoanaerobaculia bacterium]
MDPFYIASLGGTQSLIGIVVLAVLLPAGAILAVLAAARWEHHRRAQIGGAIAFLLIAVWNLASVVIRSARGDFGVLFAIEIVLALGFGFQAWWIWRVKL